MITINVEKGAVQINANTETILDIQAKIDMIFQRLDDLVVNDPAKLKELTELAAAQVERLKAAAAEHPAPLTT